MNTIVDLTFSIRGRVKLDLERAQEDPWWDQAVKGLDLDDKDQFRAAVSNYVSAYLRNEELLSNAPFTCGPADVYDTNIEVKSGGTSASSSGISTDTNV